MASVIIENFDISKAIRGRPHGPGDRDFFSLIAFFFFIFSVNIRLFDRKLKNRLRRAFLCPIYMFWCDLCIRNGGIQNVGSEMGDPKWGTQNGGSDMGYTKRVTQNVGSEMGYPERGTQTGGSEMCGP